AARQHEHQHGHAEGRDARAAPLVRQGGHAEVQFRLISAFVFGYSGGLPVISATRSEPSGVSSSRLPSEYATILPHAFGTLSSYGVSAAVAGAGTTSRSHGVAAIATSATAITVSTALRRSEEHTSELQSRSDLVCRL